MAKLPRPTTKARTNASIIWLLLTASFDYLNFANFASQLLI
ncbi:hypothetical protein COO91_07323 [Nostoc flagelliforme CCNUN1]|uniref:Uncharacterized protein n=1 Tax=Nostoc flagelliforme CCNUN1 TaxID=2038116 RepID=A0A2K8T2N7_9NOSO|nr:hypothetical protein COO91_07323 [Nostoc flagelliforme CCNUN1]